MKKLVFSLLLAIICISSFSQDQAISQTVAMFNSDNVTRSNEELQLFALAENQTNTIIPEVFAYYTSDELLPDSGSFTSHYRGIIELGYQTHFTQETNGIKFNFINSVQLAPVFSLGFGLGLRTQYIYPRTLIPIFVDLRLGSTSMNPAMYLALDLGLCSGSTNGLFMSISTGVRHKIFARNAILVGVGYEITQYQKQDHFTGSSSLRSTGVFELNLGFDF
ncbi:MAG: hypothetical protein RIS47_1798 [Bacteroidota bacterium]|jgi:hypothetical protein